MLSSHQSPTSLWITRWRKFNQSAFEVSIPAYTSLPAVSEPLPLVLTNFTISSVSSLLDQLLTDSTGVGPGKSLANKVTLAQTYYAVPDIVSTCAVLTSYLDQVTKQKGKKITPAQAEALSGDAEVIMSALACE